MTPSLPERYTRSSYSSPGPVPRAGPGEAQTPAGGAVPTLTRPRAGYQRPGVGLAGCCPAPGFERPGVVAPGLGEGLGVAAPGLSSPVTHVLSPVTAGGPVRAVQAPGPPAPTPVVPAHGRTDPSLLAACSVPLTATLTGGQGRRAWPEHRRPTWAGRARRAAGLLALLPVVLTVAAVVLLASMAAAFLVIAYVLP